MCLFQVLVPVGTTTALKMHFSRHAPRGGPSLFLKSKKSFHKISWFFLFPSRPCAPCTTDTVFPRSECAWGKGPLNTQCHGAKMLSWLRIPGGWLHTLALTCMRRTVLLQHPSVRQNQWKLLEEPAGIKPNLQDAPPSPWHSSPWGLWQSSCRRFQPGLLIWVAFQGRLGGRLHSFWPGRIGPEETKGNSYNWQGGFEISTKSRVAK